MPEGSFAGSLDAAGYVEFHVAGNPAVGEFHCSECGYGIVVQQRLPSCPMCGGSSWEETAWSALSRRRDFPIQ